MISTKTDQQAKRRRNRKGETAVYELKNSKPVNINEKVRFRCKKCGECCRNVKAAIMLEPLDAFNLAEYLNIHISDVYDKYTESFILSEEVFYPIFTLKTNEPKQSCVFLKGNRCTVQEAKPRTCRMYPFWIAPEDSGSLSYHLSTERMHHMKGGLIKVKDWVKSNCTDEDTETLKSDIKTMTELALLIKTAQNAGVKDDEIIRLILLFRYMNFETDKPFLKQKYLNDAILIKKLKEKIIIRKRNEHE